MPTESSCLSADMNCLAVNGYTVFDFLSPGELALVRAAIVSQLRLLNGFPQSVDQLSEAEWYSTLAEYSSKNVFDHKRVSDKRSRLLHGSALSRFFGV